jgi:glycine cleavage system aminomethyltransferase T
VVGDTRWASHSFALERAIAIGVVEAELAELGGSVEVEHPAGRTRLEICPLPFVD